MEVIVARIKERLGGQLLKFEEKSLRRLYLYLRPEDIPSAARALFKDLGCRFCTASAIDTPEGFEILYHFSHDRSGKIITLRTLIADKKKPAIESIAPFIKGAEWIEREIWELLGINFFGHPDLRRLLLSEDWPENNYPLRRQQ